MAFHGRFIAFHGRCIAFRGAGCITAPIADPDAASGAIAARSQAGSLFASPSVHSSSPSAVQSKFVVKLGLSGSVLLVCLAPRVSAPAPPRATPAHPRGRPGAWVSHAPFQAPLARSAMSTAPPPRKFQPILSDLMPKLIPPPPPRSPRFFNSGRFGLAWPGP